MKSKILQSILDETPKEVDIFVSLYADLVLKISQILEEKGLTQKALADSMEKSPSEIHKWLSGNHNFTLRSIAKLEAELGETLLVVPKAAKHTQFTPATPKVKLTVYVNKEETLSHQANWQYNIEISKPDKRNVG